MVFNHPIQGITMHMKERLAWGPLATFVPNKREPIHNWFYYKEGFSHRLVSKLIDDFGLVEGKTVLDPFCGAGTTLLACKQAGIASIGFDVHPVAVFAARVKTADYDPGKLNEAANGLLKARFVKPDIDARNSLIRRAFNRHTLDDVYFFRDAIMSMDDGRTRDFFLLALMNVTMKCSFAWKDGAVIKIRKHPVPPLRSLLRRQIYRMMKDIKKSGDLSPGTRTRAESGDARKMKLPDSGVDAVITSPPYLNKIEYTRIYSIEEELFFRERAKPALRSYVGIEDEKMLAGEERLGKIIDTEGLPASAIAYFSDMHETIREMHRVCKPGARLGIVVGNGCFPTGVVDSDVILSRIAEKEGFGADEIIVLNKRWCTRNRVEKVGISRESLLLWTR